MITKTKDGKYKLDVRVNGRRVIRLFKLKVDAATFERELIARPKTEQKKQQTDKRTLPELIHIWYELHGVSLKSSVDTKNRLLKLSAVLSNPVAFDLSVQHFAEYRAKRLKTGINEATLNRELSTLKALFRELKSMGVLTYDPSILKIRKLKEKKQELTYLTQTQITALLDQVSKSTNKHLYPVVLLSLSTGCRWSEAESICLSDISESGVTFCDTKNGLNRFVPVDDSLRKILLNSLPFSTCYSAFRSAYGRCAFPPTKGQLAHILRHTFASHFIMNGGNIRTLQQILGHSSLIVTMRYAHLAPGFLAQAVSLNPLTFHSGKNQESQEKEQKKPVDENA